MGQYLPEVVTHGPTADDPRQYLRRWEKTLPSKKEHISISSLGMLVDASSTTLPQPDTQLTDSARCQCDHSRLIESAACSQGRVRSFAPKRAAREIGFAPTRFQLRHSDASGGFHGLEMGSWHLVRKSSTDEMGVRQELADWCFRPYHGIGLPRGAAAPSYGKVNYGKIKTL
jgi:hypothetical protein